MSTCYLLRGRILRYILENTALNARKIVIIYEEYASWAASGNTREISVKDYVVKYLRISVFLRAMPFCLHMAAVYAPRKRRRTWKPIIRTGDTASRTIIVQWEA